MGSNNTFTQQNLCCGVCEFNPGELDENVYLPHWMIDNLCLFDINAVNIELTEIEKGTLVKIQPHQTKFNQLTNPKAILEHTLRNYTCLNENTTININYNNWICFQIFGRINC